ncbi:MAG: rod shape-determining protein MreC [bacterium]|nr:rod shape-determining protein MreC [bacterium]
MNYRFIRSVKVKGRFFDLWLPLLLIGVLVLFHIWYPEKLANLASRVAAPFWSAERFVEDEFRGAVLFFASKQKLTADIERLSAELLRAGALLHDRELLREQNAALEAQLGRHDVKEESILGSVLSSPPRSPYDTIVLDVGSREGIQAGDAVLSGSVVLGSITKVHRRASIAELYSTAGKKTSVSILHDGKSIPALATGEGGGGFTSRLPKEVTLAVGDAVVLQGLHPEVFAFVEAIEGSDSDSFQTIRFQNPVSIYSLRFLEVRKPVVQE